VAVTRVWLSDVGAVTNSTTPVAAAATPTPTKIVDSVALLRAASPRSCAFI
jgi:hypothetical protein